MPMMKKPMGGPSRFINIEVIAHRLRAYDPVKVKTV
jgi:hypothetical protein